MKIIIIDPDGETVAEYESDNVPQVDDKIRMEDGDYYIVNKKTWYLYKPVVVLLCAYYGNIE